MTKIIGIELLVQKSPMYIWEFSRVKPSEANFKKLTHHKKIFTTYKEKKIKEQRIGNLQNDLI